MIDSIIQTFTEEKQLRLKERTIAKDKLIITKRIQWKLEVRGWEIFEPLIERKKWKWKGEKKAAAAAKVAPPVNLYLGLVLGLIGIYPCNIGHFRFFPVKLFFWFIAL